MDEEKKYEVIKELADHPNGNKQRAALILGCTPRHINRMLKGYKEEGRAYFVHGNKGRKPVNAISDERKARIIDLYLNKYYGASITHFTELLKLYEGISISASCIASILDSEYILSPKATKKKKNRMKKELEEKKKAAKSKREADIIQANLVNVEDAHSRRPRCAYFGELLQMDASGHEWFDGKNTTLHVAIDDATGMITGAWFDKEETLNGYYQVLHQILTNYGIPYKLFTDRRSIFTYKKKNTPSVDEDSYTQFSYACKQLGIAVESSSVPQAKGRVERLIQTLQSRLPVELRLAGITTITAANEFLPQYIEKFNAQFALPIHHIKSVFDVQPSQEKINLTLAVLSERTVDCGHCIQYAKHYYRMLDANGFQVHFSKGTKVMVIKALDGSLYCCVNDQDIYALEEIPEREEKSREFDSDFDVPKPQRKYIPPMNHPWRRQNFKKFVQSQYHHRNDGDWQCA